MTQSLEQTARDMLERCGWEEAQCCSSGGVLEVANLLQENAELRAEVERLESLCHFAVKCLAANKALLYPDDTMIDALQEAANRARNREAAEASQEKP